MSKRNSQEAKRAARERLRIEREKQAKKEKVRRQLFVGGAVVGLLAVVGGVAFAVTTLGGDDGSDKDWGAAKNAKLVQPANAEGDKGTAVVLGGKDAEKTVDVYEDLRCPACAQFEQQLGERIKKGAEGDKYQLRVHLGAIIDGNFGGNGSKNAASALGAALDVSTEAFKEYHGLLYSADHHPAESEDKFADNEYLLDVAKNVDELKGNKQFQKNVEKGTFDKWALEMIDSFNDAGIEGTPTIKIDGKKVESNALPAELDKLGA
ncbi:thioredoxin domain-containing protein [Streptomyces sp. CMB-StM0423]|uniref:thioredoxin domain-containing protein n=1 Tax=Streptomyces sp. CMB-StM0423 TaxID=2059884 RepID=UPI000C70F384|nr:thioredoxin domain-containing protein [Streptomyces sp. CMB-StM0423]AUH43526.1 disulfide bond formation protein DsbA [Streptomyces sp. CMB-StM0423]